MKRLKRFGSWGLGVNHFDDPKETCYGYPCVSDPRDFSPDYECCTKEEIENWERDCLAAKNASKEEWDEIWETHVGKVS